MLRMVAIHTVVFSYSEENTPEHRASLISSCEGVWLMLLFQKQGSGLSLAPHRRYPFLTSSSCLVLFVLRLTHATGTEGCLEDWKIPSLLLLLSIEGKSPPYPASEHVFLSGTLPLSPSSLLNRSQGKDFCSRLDTHILRKHPGTTSAYLGLKFFTFKMQELGQPIPLAMYTFLSFVNCLCLA